MKRGAFKMIEALCGNPNSYFCGTKYTNTISKYGQYFEYELLTEIRRTYGTVITNLIKTQGRTTIKTNFNLDWKPRQIVILEDGKAFKIQEVATMNLEVSPQVNSLFANPNTDFVLSLVGIVNSAERK